MKIFKVMSDKLGELAEVLYILGEFTDIKSMAESFVELYKDEKTNFIKEIKEVVKDALVENNKFLSVRVRTELDDVMKTRGFPRLDEYVPEKEPERPTRSKKG